MSIAPNTHRLLLEQGIKDSQLKASPLTYVWRGGSDGKVLSESLSESLARFGATTIFTRRSRLHAALYGLATGDLRPGKPAQVIEEVKISEVDVAAGMITAESGETYRADLIIGADGINSAVRAAVLLANSDSVNGVAPLLTGVAAYQCTVPIAVLRDDPSLDEPRTRFIFFPADEENLQVVAYHPEDDWVAQFEQSRSSIIKDIPAERAVQDFLEFHPSLQNLLTSATTRDVWRIRDLAQFPKWHSGKAILIGDAAHAVTPHFGQGCNIAIEDGEALGYFLRNLPSAVQIPAALESFETIRIPRAHMVQLACHRVGGLLTAEEQKNAGPFNYPEFVGKLYGYTSAENTWEALKVGTTSSV
ncbi:FAD/NAD(P)-binding domain-containing protein [Mycena venus]|uniref:FAD/NAD(P)-binding domain-containing protein n=1 Tax=Mycena venus TaxID=2733690 RepID=A0A8H7DAH5_9AGAR|nr:FAD/NAD(P)-binding domain-containing protein [Mycena venus]